MPTRSHLHLQPNPTVLSRLPVVGINSNVEVEGETFHMQTEDLAPRLPHLVTHVFGEGGRVVKRVKVDYSLHLDKPHLRAGLTRALRIFHRKVILNLQRQRLSSIPPAICLRPSFPPLAAPPALEGEAPAHSERRPTLAPLSRVPSLKESSAVLWERAVASAAKDLLPEGSSPSPLGREPAEEPSPASTSWDRAVQSARATRVETRHGGPRVKSPAAEAFTAGMSALRKGDLEHALRHLTRAVDLEPETIRYRTALRHALDSRAQA